MGEFFRGWRRKIGVATLVLVCTFTTLWVRSESASQMITILLACNLISGQDGTAPKAGHEPTLNSASIKKWADSDLVITGKITKVGTQFVNHSEPPIYNYNLEIVSNDVLRESTGTHDRVTASYSIMQEAPPSFPHRNDACVLGLKFVRDRWVLQIFENASTENLVQAKLAASLPLGWTIDEGKLVSPWAGKLVSPSAGKLVLPRATVGRSQVKDEMCCSVTGRPVLLVGKGIELHSKAVLPADLHPSWNPDGNGEFDMIVTNVTASEIEIPALLTDGNAISWRESFVIRCQGVAYPLSGSTGTLVGLRSVKLRPHESVTGRFNALDLNGPKWPNGGGRVEFQFCLGEKSTTQSFYYYSTFHDKFRETRQLIKLED